MRARLPVRYYDLKAADLGELVKLPRMGKTLHRLVHQFPRVELAASVQPITRGLLRVELTITPDFLFDQKVCMPEFFRFCLYRVWSFSSFFMCVPFLLHALQYSSSLAVHINWRVNNPFFF